MKNDFINDIRLRAGGHWETILTRLNIPVNRKEGPCPACGGNTRYRFDDLEGRGTYLCSHCGAGTGLDLVMEVYQCNAKTAALQVAQAMGYSATDEGNHISAPSTRKVGINSTRDATTHSNQTNVAYAIPLAQTKITEKVNKLALRLKPGQSDYLTRKGFNGHFPLLADGSPLLMLTNSDNRITGAQLISRNGQKRLLAGTVKQGAFYLVNSPAKLESIDVVILAEGYATALTIQLLYPQTLIVSALDAGNLPHVAAIMRTRYPQAKIVIAADNDAQDGKANTGLIKAEQAAKRVTGWVALPPGNEKRDWNDYYLIHGLTHTRQTFTHALYQLDATSPPRATEHNKFTLMRNRGKKSTLLRWRITKKPACLRHTFSIN